MPPVFAGLDNYVKLAKDGFFRRAVVNRFIFTFASVGVKVLIGMAMAIITACSRSCWIDSK